MPSALADTAVGTAVLLRARGPGHVRELRAVGERLPKSISRVNRLDSILAPNVFMRDKLIAYGVDPQRVREVAYGVDLPHDIVAAPTRSADAPLRIGFIGTLAPHKGAHVLLDAFSRLPPGTATLRIHGAGLEFPDYVVGLHEAAHSMVGVELAGTFRPANIFRVLAEMDVLVVPSMWVENTPLVVYSAQAAGIPVVASNFPGLACAVRDTIDGFLFAPGNAEALAELLTRMAASPACLGTLRKQILPPKSTSNYVSELLQAWQA